jgi:hypothetical protein
MAYLSHPLTVNQVSYLAGLYEAEGAFIAGTPSKPRTPVVILGMTDCDVVKRVGEMLRVAVLTVKAGSARWKTVYRVHLNGGRAVSFLKLLHPYMGERREAQIQALMDCYKPRNAYPHDTYSLIRDQGHDLDRYWIAGLCEGEGYFTRTRDVKPYGTYFYPEVVISSTDLDVVRRSQQIICTRYEVDVKIHSPKQSKW